MFQWKSRDVSWLPSLVAMCAVGGLFALALGSLRVTVPASVPVFPESASVIHAGDDAAGRALTSLAREKGPFPARVDVMALPMVAGMERSAIAAMRNRLAVKLLEFRKLPDTGNFPDLRKTNRVTMVFPPLPRPAVLENSVETIVVPRLYPLAGISAKELPADLPPLGIEIDAPMVATIWRFLIRLGPDGSVIDAVSLAGGDVDGSTQSLRLVAWLRGLRFSAGPPNADIRIIAVGLGFVNQPMHGTESR